MKIRYFIIIIILVSVFTYANTLQNGFTSEDYSVILKSDIIPYWQNVRVLFSMQNIIAPFPIKNASRPLTLLSLMFDFRIWQFNPFGYHLTNLILHSFISVLVFCLFLTLRTSKNIAFWTAVIYCVHPIQTEVVNVAGFRGDLLSVFFFLLGLIFFILAVRKRKTALFYVPLIFVSFLGAILAKEIAITFPLVCMLFYAVFVEKKHVWVNFLSVFLLGFGIFYICAFWFKRYNYDIFNVIFVNLTGPVRPYTSFLAYINTITITLFHNIKTVIFPYMVSYEYQIKIPMILSLKSILGFLILGAIILTFRKNTDKHIKFSLGMAMICYLPVSNILPLYNIVADRYMYLSMIGFSFILLSISTNIFTRMKTVFNKKYTFKKLPVEVGIFIGILILGSFTGKSVMRNRIFKDLGTLYEDTINKAPENIRARYNMGVAYREKDKWKESNDEFLKVLSLNKIYKVTSVWQMMGENYQMLGDLKNAKKYYMKVIMLEPRRETINNLAEIMYKEGNIKLSKELWERLLDLNPDDKFAIAGLNLIE